MASNPSEAQIPMHGDKEQETSFEETNRPEQPLGMAGHETKYTPEMMISAPRRSAPQISIDGTHALYTVSTYSFESHKKTKEIRLLDMQTKHSTLITNNEKASEPHWLENEILYLKEGKDKGTTELLVASIDGEMKTYTAAVVPGSISDLKLKAIAPGKVAVVCTGKATRDGKLYNEETQVKRKHTGMVYDSTFVRHWDHYLDTTKSSLWYGLFTLGSKHGAESKGRYSLSELENALKGTELESPIGPFGGADCYDISTNSVVFVARDPTLNPAFHTKADFYHMSIPDFAAAPPSLPRQIQAKGIQGAATGPAISADGKSAVYMQMKVDGYEADKNRLLLIQDLASSDHAIEVHASDDGKGSWDSSPSKAVWGDDGQHLYLIAEDKGRGIVFDASLDTVSRHIPPIPLTQNGRTNEIVPLSKTKLLLAGDNLVDNSLWSTLDVSQPNATPEVFSSNTDQGAAFGLSHSNLSEIHFQGAAGRTVQAWVLKPSHSAAAGKDKLPLAMLVHGGPQNAWVDGWSTRWNPAVFAEQGYIVVLPNPTGSTSFGQAFTDAIRFNWGGAPYEDIVACYNYVATQMSHEVDMDHAVALGASYGGYMMNWIQGHNLGRKFKALVCHDGVFSTEFATAQEEQYFPLHDMGGQLWQRPDIYNKNNPAKHLAQWSTPQLLIHSEKDYRLSMSEGLAPFNILQARGVESRLLYFPDENHFVQNEENSRVWHTVVINWINKFAGLPQYADEEEIVGPAVGGGYKKEDPERKW